MEPIFRIFFWQLFSPPCRFRSSGVENPPAALPSATAALRVWLRRVRSAASYQGQAAAERPSNAGKFQWPKRLKVGLGKKPGKTRGREQVKEQRRGGRDRRWWGGVKWDADFSSKPVLLDFFSVIMKKEPGLWPALNEIKSVKMSQSLKLCKVQLLKVPSDHRNPALSFCSTWALGFESSLNYG